MIVAMDSLYSIVSAGASSVPAKRVFTDGERVFVRVLGEARSEGGGAGRYTVSFGGMRFSADSLRPLRPGDSFPALVKVQDGKIALAPQWEAAQAASESAFAALSRMGVSSDAISLAIVRFMQQSGFKFDFESASRARKLARHFPGRETKAAEAALYLLKKGIDADERMVEEILFLHGESEGGYRDSGARDEHQPREKTRRENLPEDNGLLGFFDGESLSRSQPGLLTLANHIAASDRHWILLPFELGKNITGIIKVLLNLAQKTAEKAEIRAQLGTKFFRSVIYYTSVQKEGASRTLEIVLDGSAEDAGVLSRLLAARGVDAVVRVRDMPDGGLFTEGEGLLTFQADA